MTTPLRQRMIEDMQLRGLSEKTQETYLRTVRQLAEYYGKSPEHIEEEELRQYFLYLGNEKQVSPSTFTQALCGIKFFYVHTLRQEWSTLDLIRARRAQRVRSTADTGMLIPPSLPRMPQHNLCLWSASAGRR